MVIRLKWKLFLKAKIAILSLSLSLISCAKISQIEPKFSGNFKTEHIRQSWQMCSVAHQKAKVSQVVYYQLCDCAVDTIRTRFKDGFVLQNINKTESDELAVLIRLNCNEYRNGSATN